MTLYLASLSPRRRELLDQIHVAYCPVAVTVDETPYPGESPYAYVTRLALVKAQAGLKTVLSSYPTVATPLVLGADTTVVCDGNIFGKPSNEEEANSMLTQLSGRSHQVMTAIAIASMSREQVAVNVSNVYFRTLSKTEIVNYIATKEPLDKAGGYAIQGYASIFIERIEGSYSGVMGLPLYETAQLLADNGLDILH